MYIEDMPKLLSIESCKSSKEKTKIQAFRKGSCINIQKITCRPKLTIVPKGRKTKVQNTKEKDIKVKTLRQQRMVGSEVQMTAGKTPR